MFVCCIKLFCSSSPTASATGLMPKMSSEQIGRRRRSGTDIGQLKFHETADRHRSSGLGITNVRLASARSAAFSRLG